MELISVIVPVYQAEKYVDRCIRSIVRQTYPEIEIIIVDDGSTDRSLQICQEWEKKDPRIRTVHQENRGVSAARNTGLQEARGTYILMVDSDDYITEDTISILHHISRKYGSEIVICDFQEGEEGNFQFGKPEYEDVRMLSPDELMKLSYSDGHQALRVITPWAKLYRRDLFTDIRYPEGKIFEDIYITHRLLWRCTKVAITDAALWYYFVHADSIMHADFSLAKLDYLDALKDRIVFFETQNEPELRETAYDEYMHALIWEYSRTHDLLHDLDAANTIHAKFRSAYQKGRRSVRYPEETRLYRWLFFTSPVLLKVYWKIQSLRRHGKSK